MKKILWVDQMMDPKIEKIEKITSGLNNTFPDEYDNFKSFNNIQNDQLIKYKLLLLHWNNNEFKQETPRKVSLKKIRDLPELPALLFYSGEPDKKLIDGYSEKLKKSLNQAGFPENQIKSIKIIPTKTLLVNLSKALDNTKNAINTGSEIEAEWFSEKTPHEDVISKFSDLKHKIVHIFLPLDVNMDCIERVNEKNKPKKMIECFEDFLQEQLVRGKKFSAKLDELHRIIYLDTKGKNDKKNDTIFAVLEAITKEKPDYKKIFMDNWENILKYAGVSCNNENPFDVENFNPNDDAPIKKFFKELDKALENKNKITENGITKILSHFKNQREYDCDDFHGWFEKLIKTLENLRRDLQQIEILKLSK